MCSTLYMMMLSAQCMFLLHASYEILNWFQDALSCLSLRNLWPSRPYWSSFVNHTKKHFLNPLNKMHNSYHVGCLGDTLVHHPEWTSKSVLAYFSGVVGETSCIWATPTQTPEQCTRACLDLNSQAPSDFPNHSPALKLSSAVWDSPGASSCFWPLCKSFLALRTQLNRTLLPLSSSLRAAEVTRPGFHSCQALRSRVVRHS